MDGALAEVLPISVFAFTAFGHSWCLNFLNGIWLLRGVEDSSMLFSGFRHTARFMCVTGRKFWIGGHMENSVIL